MRLDGGKQGARGESRPAVADEAGECFIWLLSRGATRQGRQASFPVLIGDRPAGLAVPLHAMPVPHTPLLSDLSH